MTSGSGMNLLDIQNKQWWQEALDVGILLYNLICF